MHIKLLTSINSIIDMVKNAAIAALTCHGNVPETIDTARAEKILTNIIKLGHESILEHISLTYSIKGLKRACLQELARHRHISLSVQSTRHTLRKQITDNEWLKDFAETADINTILVLKQFIAIFRDNPEMPNDELKYFLPEFYPTNLILTTNIRELRHILDLRTAPQALEEFRHLARGLYETVSDDFKYLLKDCVHEEINKQNNQEVKFNGNEAEN